jgi:ribosomal protein S15P/S13E
MASDQVTPFVYELCRMDRFGGRCVKKDAGVWEVLDINHWTEEQVVALHQRFPSISAHVEANRKSLGGFCVVLHQHRASHAWIAVLVCAVMVTVVFSLVKFITFH